MCSKGWAQDQDVDRLLHQEDRWLLNEHRTTSVQFEEKLVSGSQRREVKPPENWSESDLISLLATPEY